MKKLYEKNELVFAILWIVVYVVICGTVRNNFGDDSPIMMAVLAVFTAGILIFVGVNKLWERYGLCKWQGSAAGYLFFVPLIILMTGNLWNGFKPQYEGMGQIYAVVSAAMVGFVEEMIFRGFLFRILLKKDPAPVAIAISAVTFGVGHIVNLFTGHGNLETVIQIFYAIAFGFMFTFVFYKSGSLIMCIIAHSLVDVFARFSLLDQNKTIMYIYFGAIIGVSIVYCIYLSRKQTALSKE